MIREAMASRAETAIIPVQDLLELGSEARMNRPGTTKDNWRWRLKDGALTEALAGRLRDLSAAHGRLRPGELQPVPRQRDEKSSLGASDAATGAAGKSAR
jgi:4-alpha-glucanotransferase